MHETYPTTHNRLQRSPVPKRDILPSAEVLIHNYTAIPPSRQFRSEVRTPKCLDGTTLNSFLLAASSNKASFCIGGRPAAFPASTEYPCSSSTSARDSKLGRVST